MRKISASLVCPISSPIIKRGVIVVDSDGIIREIRGPLEKEEANIEYYSGILIPGLVNAHCHLELSHLKGVIPQKMGMAGFVEAIMEQRGADESVINQAIKTADRFMLDAGINLVGDISNDNTTFEAKAKSKIAYHTFVEAFSPSKFAAQKIIAEKSAFVIEARDKFELSASPTLHAPYSISPELVSEYNKISNANEAMSLHLFEGNEEIDYMERNGGPLATLYKKNGRKEQPKDQWGNNTYANILQSLQAQQKMIAIHACNLTQAYFDLLNSMFRELWFVLCPKSNLYIHNQLPPIDLIRKNTENIALGTDSLASNNILSILEEMKTISSNYSDIPFEEILKWSTLNGAMALGQESIFGSFEVNKKPGILLLTDIDTIHPHLSEKTKLRRLV